MNPLLASHNGAYCREFAHDAVPDSPGSEGAADGGVSRASVVCRSDRCERSTPRSLRRRCLPGRRNRSGSGRARQTPVAVDVAVEMAELAEQGALGLGVARSVQKTLRNQSVHRMTLHCHPWRQRSWRKRPPLCGLVSIDQQLNPIAAFPIHVLDYFDEQRFCPFENTLSRGKIMPLMAGQEPECFEVLSLQFPHLGKQLGSYTEVDGFRAAVRHRALNADSAARAD